MEFKVTNMDGIKYHLSCPECEGMTFEELLDKTLAELKSEYEQVKAMHDSMCIDRQTASAQFQSTE